MSEGQNDTLPEIKGGGYMPKVLSPFTWTHIRLPQIDLSRIT